MTRVCIELDGELHKAVRKNAIDEGIPMKDYIVRLVRKIVEVNVRTESEDIKGDI